MDSGIFSRALQINLSQKLRLKILLTKLHIVKARGRQALSLPCDTGIKTPNKGKRKYTQYSTAYLTKVSELHTVISLVFKGINFCGSSENHINGIILL